MNRKGLLVAGAGLALPAVADAAQKHMGPKFNHAQELRRDGYVVHARGPFGKAITNPAYVAVVIMQGHRFGHGMSELYLPGDKHWDADVFAEHGNFRPGRAMAHGVVIRPESDDVYTYAWSMHVDLV